MQTRQGFGRFLSCLTLIAMLAAPPARAAGLSDAEILHFLDRASFGPAPGDIDAVRKQGLDYYLNRQLHPAELPPNPALDQRLAQLTTLNEPMAQLAHDLKRPANFKSLPEEERKEIAKRENAPVIELSEAKILRAAASPAQLQEVMVDFWFNHFNVFAEKGLDKLMVASYERDAIRPYALGKFGDLLSATAHHPAMLFYLDNWLNTDPNSSVARGKKIGINENYARELMELHTLGVDGGYTQTDVTNLAHILTGWGLSPGKDEADRTEFFFDARRHDFAPVNWLGYRMSGSANEIDQVIYILAHHPATAHHIAYQMAQYFVTDDPPKALVDRLAQDFLSYDGDISHMLWTLFHSQEFWDAKYSGQKFKPPFRYVVSALRAAGVMPNGDTRLLQGVIAQMGEPLYRCLTPNGYSNTNDQWMNSDALLKRIDFSKKAASLLDDNAGPTIYQSLAPGWSRSTYDAAAAAKVKLQPALLLASPEFVSY